MACAWHAVDRGEIKPGDTVVVGGVGNIGLCMLQIAKLANPGQLIALDTKAYRLDLAGQLGADVTIDVTIDVTRENPVERVRALTDGYGCDVSIEASGSPAAIEPGLRMVRKLGTVVASASSTNPPPSTGPSSATPKNSPSTAATSAPTATPRSSTRWRRGRWT